MADYKFCCWIIDDALKFAWARTCFCHKNNWNMRTRYVSIGVALFVCIHAWATKADGRNRYMYIATRDTKRENWIVAVACVGDINIEHTGMKMSFGAPICFALEVFYTNWFDQKWTIDLRTNIKYLVFKNLNLFHLITFIVVFAFYSFVFTTKIDLFILCEYSFINSLFFTYVCVIFICLYVWRLFCTVKVGYK